MRNKILLWIFIFSSLFIGFGCGSNDDDLPIEVCDPPANFALNFYNYNDPAEVRYQWDNDPQVDSALFQLRVFDTNKNIIEELSTIVYSNNVSLEVGQLEPGFELQANLSNFCGTVQSTSVESKLLTAESDCQSPEELGLTSFATEGNNGFVTYEWLEPSGVDSFHFVLAVINTAGAVVQEFDTITTNSSIDLVLTNLMLGDTLMAQVSSLCDGQESSPPTIKIDIVIDDVVMGKVVDPNFGDCCPNCQTADCYIKFDIDEVDVNGTSYSTERFKVFYPADELCSCMATQSLTECLQDITGRILRGTVTAEKICE